MTSLLSNDTSIHFYNEHAAELAAHYLSIQFEAVHQAWLPHLQQIIQGSRSAYRIIDIGAGSGRDVKYLAELSTDERPIEVYAVEPAQSLAEVGKALTSKVYSDLVKVAGAASNTIKPVTWLEDKLPQLRKTQALNLKFDLILLSAVWMHIDPSERCTALHSMAKLLTADGKIIITLRHGKSDDERVMHQVSIEELQVQSLRNGLSIIDHTILEADKLGRNQVQWQTAILARNETREIA
ncbi:class I SAM-dependent methyltransferase [Shewanella abyssi]|uniref:class I SAM-dependent methyltransferase n=1 Tax=Shewanella abyssi TaxID=311789 RepID=UPI00200F860F|nr:class I SAM-dependent methyltransferase [Shewanella abyssi]MCL1052165.1 class I SAM-dependent methyltransferase [Shewanella abyssi]